MNLPQRRLQRLKNYDYSQNGAYFITICTHDRLPLFGTIENNTLTLNNAGIMVSEKLLEISKLYPNVIIDKFIVMPNHLHAIIILEQENLEVRQEPGTTQWSFPTLSEYIQRYKTLTTKLYIDGVKNGEYPPFDKKIWQKSYYDHVIRNERVYKEVWEYIDTNPIKWSDDNYFV